MWMLAASESSPQVQWLTFSKNQEKLHMPLSLVNPNDVNAGCRAHTEGWVCCAGSCWVRGTGAVTDAQLNCFSSSHFAASSRAKWE